MFSLGNPGQWRGLAAAFAAFLALAFPPQSVAAKEIHVFSQSQNPVKPYPTHETAAKTLLAAVTEAVAGDVILVHGKCCKDVDNDGFCDDGLPGKPLTYVPCEYQEATTVPLPCGVMMTGRVDEFRDGSDYWRPIIKGKRQGPVIRAGPCAPDPASRVGIVHFVIRNGKADYAHPSPDDPRSIGGGIQILDAPALIQGNCIFGNEAVRGGGIAIRWSTKKFVPSFIEGNIIGERSALDTPTDNSNKAVEEGGGIYIAGSYHAGEDSPIDDYHAHISRNIISGNTITGADKYVGGGGLSVFRARVLTEENLFDANRSQPRESKEADGGAVYVRNFDENTVSVSDVWRMLGTARPKQGGQYTSVRNIYRRNAADRAGGAVAIIGWASASFDEDRFMGNWSESHGGAIYTSLAVDIDISNSLFTGRYKDSTGAVKDVSKSKTMPDTGGGLYISCGSALALRNSIFEHLTTHARPDQTVPRNHARNAFQGGAAVYVRNSRATMSGTVLRHNTATVAQGYKDVGLQTSGGGFFGIEIDKIHLMESRYDARAQGEAAACNNAVSFELKNNHFLDNRAINGGAIAVIMLGSFSYADYGKSFVVVEGDFFNSRRPRIEGNTIENNRGGGILYNELGGVRWGEQTAEGTRGAGDNRKGTADIVGNDIVGNQSFGLKVVESVEGGQCAFREMPTSIAEDISTWGAINVYKNRIRNNENSGVIVQCATTTHITDNLIEHNRPTQIELAKPVMLPLVRNNEIRGGPAEGGKQRFQGVLVRLFESHLDPGYPRITDNNIVDNGLAAIAYKNKPGVTVLMPRNWWGTPAGPPLGGANGITPDVSPAYPQPTPVAFSPPAVATPPRVSEPGGKQPPQHPCTHTEKEPTEQAYQTPPKKKQGRLVSPEPLPGGPGGPPPPEKKQGRLVSPEPPPAEPQEGKDAGPEGVCPDPRADKPITVGDNSEIGSGARIKDKVTGAVGGLIGGLLGGGGGGGLPGLPGGSARRETPGFGAPAGGGEEPRLAPDPIPDDEKQTFVDDGTGAKVALGGRMTPDGLQISATLVEAPGNGTFQAVFLEDSLGRRMAPDRYDIYDLYRDWTLTVSWTFDRWVNGQHVEHREGGWSEQGRDYLARFFVPAGGNGLWKELGFDKAVNGIKSLGIHFPTIAWQGLKTWRSAPSAPPLPGNMGVRMHSRDRPGHGEAELLAQADAPTVAPHLNLVVHVTRPEEDPVTTVPLIWRIVPVEGGRSVRFEKVARTAAQARCERAKTAVQ